MEPDRTDAFVDAYERHVDGVRRSAQEVLRDPAQAEDVAQEVFMALWRHPDRYDADRAGLGTYLRVMARSRALDALRSANAADRARTRLERTATGLEHGPAPGDVVDRALVRSAVRKLPQAQREAVALAYWCDMTSHEIARRCSVPHGTAKGRVRLGLRKLRGSMAVAWVASASELVETVVLS
jgi:RNA polymerase sigma-70 factor, ECF subfamily